MSVLVQVAAFATDVPPDIYAFHRYTGNSTTLYHTLVRQYQMQFRGSTSELHLILLNSSSVEGSRIPGVAVKCVDIGRNTSGEGGYLDQN